MGEEGARGKQILPFHDQDNISPSRGESWLFPILII